ncbi:YajG family lipoprotein [Microbulbifer sp. 2201CG32-9]|uniref:YajG family lipoprotein n=1 Tax=Microbulbifer sp. 2201CG32-9 TaxID=3232309 RepID=UPI00345C5314
MNKLMLFVGCCALVACAHSPVQVDLRPQVTVAPESIGAGRTISIRGVNQLQGSGLGSLGGVYASDSQVQLANNVEQAMADTLRDGFTQWSFQPVADDADVQIVASLTSLRYSSPDKLITTEVDTSAGVQLQVTIGGATYYGSYRSSGRDRNLIKPDRDEVEARINGLLSATLQRAFEDEKLKNFLRTHG